MAVGGVYLQAQAVQWSPGKRIRTWLPVTPVTQATEANGLLPDVLSVPAPTASSSASASSLRLTGAVVSGRWVHADTILFLRGSPSLNPGDRGALRLNPRSQ